MIDQHDFLRCAGCEKKLGAKLQGRVEIVCPRCHRFNVFVLPLSTNGEASVNIVPKPVGSYFLTNTLESVISNREGEPG